MEVQSKLLQDHTKQLDTIKGIQKNLMLLKTSIEHLTREKDTTNVRIQKIFQKSIPLIKDKFAEVEQKNRKKQWVSVFRLPSGCPHKVQNLQARSISLSAKCANKQNTPQLIRQMKQKNHQIICKRNENNALMQKRRNEQIRLEQLKTKSKIQQFYLLKKYHIRKQRKKQTQQLKNKIKEYKYLVNRAEAYRQQLKKQVEQEKIITKNMRNALGVVKQIDNSDLNQIKNNLGLNLKGSEMKNREAEKVLLYIENKRNKNGFNKQNNSKHNQSY